MCGIQEGNRALKERTGNSSIGVSAGSWRFGNVEKSSIRNLESVRSLDMASRNLGNMVYRVVEKMEFLGFEGNLLGFVDNLDFEGLKGAN